MLSSQNIELTNINETLKGRLSSKEHLVEHLQGFADRLQQSLAIKSAENKSLRLLGGGIDIQKYYKKIEQEDDTIDLATLREMMIRNKMSSPNKGKRAEYGTTKPFHKQSVLYDDMQELQNKKKITLRDLLGPRRLDNRKQKLSCNSAIIFGETEDKAYTPLRRKMQACSNISIIHVL